MRRGSRRRCRLRAAVDERRPRADGGGDLVATAASTTVQRGGTASAPAARRRLARQSKTLLGRRILSAVTVDTVLTRAACSPCAGLLTRIITPRLPMRGLSCPASALGETVTGWVDVLCYAGRSFTFRAARRCASNHDLCAPHPRDAREAPFRSPKTRRRGGDVLRGVLCALYPTYRLSGGLGPRIVSLAGGEGICASPVGGRLRRPPTGTSLTFCASFLPRQRCPGAGAGRSP